MVPPGIPPPGYVPPPAYMYQQPMIYTSGPPPPGHIPIAPPHVTNHVYASNFPPIQQKVEPPSVKQNRANRAVPIVNPTTREALRTSQVQLKPNVPEFIPGSKRNEQQQQRPVER